MGRFLIEALICVFMGAAFGWFVGVEWGKAHPDPVMIEHKKINCPRPEDNKDAVCRAPAKEIKVLYWQ